MQSPTSIPEKPPRRPLTLLDLPLDAWAAILEAGREGERSDDGGERSPFPRPSPPEASLRPSDVAALRRCCRSLDETLGPSSAALLCPASLALRASRDAAAWLLEPRRSEALPPLPSGAEARLSSSFPFSVRASTVRSLWLDLVDDDAAALLGQALVGSNGGRKTATPFLESLDLCVARLPSLRAAEASRAAGAPPPTLDVAAFVPRITEDDGDDPRDGSYRGLRHLGVHGAAASLRAAASREGGRRLRELVSLSLDVAHSGAVWEPCYRGWGDVAALGLGAASGEEGAAAASNDDDERGDETGDEVDEASLAATPKLRSLSVRLSPSPRASWQGAEASRIPARQLTSLEIVVSTPLREELAAPVRDLVAASAGRLRRLRVVNRGGGAPSALALPPDDGADRGGGEGGDEPSSRPPSLSLEVSRSPLLDPTTAAADFPSPTTAAGLRRQERESVPAPPRERAPALASLVTLSIGTGTSPFGGDGGRRRPVVADLSVLRGAPHLARLELRDYGLVRGLGPASTPSLRALAVRVSPRHGAGGRGDAVVVEWPRSADEAPRLRSLEVTAGMMPVAFRVVGGGGEGEAKESDVVGGGGGRREAEKESVVAASGPSPADDALLSSRGAALGATLWRLCYVSAGPSQACSSEIPCRFLRAAVEAFSRDKNGENGVAPVVDRLIFERQRRSSGPASAAAASSSPKKKRAKQEEEGGGEDDDGSDLDDDDEGSGSCSDGGVVAWPVRVFASHDTLLGPASASGAALKCVSVSSSGAPRRLVRELFGRRSRGRSGRGTATGAGEGAAFAALGPLPPAALALPPTR